MRQTTMEKRAIAFAVACASAAIVACGGGDAATDGVTDSGGVRDAGARVDGWVADDAGSPDGAPDAAPDAQLADLGLTDGGQGDRDASRAPTDGPSDHGPLDAGPPDPGPNPLVPRVDNTSCVFPIDGTLGSYTFPDAFPSLPDFTKPIWVGHAPGEPATLYAAEQGGVVYAFDHRPSVSTRTEFLRRTVATESNEEGLLGLAFHPDYPTNGRFFIHYSSTTGCPTGSSRCGVIAERRRQSARIADPTFERRVLVVAQPFGTHNGGAIAFGPDGRLYIALGDGGSDGDALDNGQRPTTLLGSILRIDVDQVPVGQSYGVPTDNPFAAGVGGRPEVWAWGFRNPWRMSFDRATGELWTGDVGENDWEEIDLVVPGNFGWNVREGSHCHPSGTTGCPSTFIDPIHEYPHSEGQSVTGGVVYRGATLTELWGEYLFADFASGSVWSLRRGAGAPRVTLLGSAFSNVSTFGEDSAGEPMMATFDGRIRRLERTSTTTTPPPPTLSATGCFSDLRTMSPAPGVIPYDVNVELWSDGAEKSRWIVLPAGATATLSADGRVQLPDGSMLIKHFAIAERGRAELRRLETRFLVKSGGDLRGFTYHWNTAQTDATLLEGTLTDTVATPSGSLDWSYPSRAQCLGCHTAAAGQVLGFRAQQLQRTIDYGSGPFPQLLALTDAGYLVGAASRPAYPPIVDGSATIERRARAYLATNCAMCHQPTGPGNARIDLRFETPFADTGTCDELPQQGDLGLTTARLLAPGDPGSSVLHARMATRGRDQMPPLATRRVDTTAASLLGRWIQRLSACP